MGEHRNQISNGQEALVPSRVPKVPQPHTGRTPSLPAPVTPRCRVGRRPGVTVATLGVRRCQPVVGLVRNTRRYLPIWISSPLASTADCTGLRLR